RALRGGRAQAVPPRPAAARVPSGAGGSGRARGGGRGRGRPAAMHDSDSAAQLFLSWLEQREQGRASSFDELCAARPELGPRLEALRATHERARELLEPAPAPGLEGTRYELRGEIARGGMGAILEAYDPSLRRTIAMKVVRTRRGEGGRPSTRAEGARRESRLLAEAQVLAQLDHPGVVAIHEVGADAHGRAFFT